MIMKLFFAFIAFIATLISVHAQPVEINELIPRLSEFAGKELTVSGIVDRVSASKRMVVLRDASKAACTDGCERKVLVVSLPDSVPIPGQGQRLIVTGLLNAAADPPHLKAFSLELRE